MILKKIKIKLIKLLRDTTHKVLINLSHNFFEAACKKLTLETNNGCCDFDSEIKLLFAFFYQFILLFGV